MESSTCKRGVIERRASSISVIQVTWCRGGRSVCFLSYWSITNALDTVWRSKNTIQLLPTKNLTTQSHALILLQLPYAALFFVCSLGGDCVILTYGMKYFLRKVYQVGRLISFSRGNLGSSPTGNRFKVQGYG